MIYWKLFKTVIKWGYKVWNEDEGDWKKILVQLDFNFIDKYPFPLLHLLDLDNFDNYSDC